MKKTNMFKFSSIATAAAMSLFAVSAPQAKAAECGTSDNIQIAEMSWLSAGVLAHVTNKILTDGYGCTTEMVPLDTVPAATSMLNKGAPDIAPELWVSTAASIWDSILEKGVAYKANDIFENGGEEGWWVPDYVLKDNPGLKSVTDLKDHPELFADPSNPDQGRLYGCPPGWACEIVTSNLFAALGLEENFELFSPGSGENLKASIARQVTRKKPVVAYYWSPTDVVGKYNLVRLGMPASDPAKFKCLSEVNCENPQVTGWAVGEVAIAVTTELKEKAPNVADFLSKMQVPNGEISRVLAWGDDNSASPEEVAVYFLENHEGIWNKWVPADVASKVKSAL